MTRRHADHFATYYGRQLGERFIAGAAPRTPDDAPVLTHKMPPPLEKDIQTAALELLSVHPRVAFVWRQNTGGFEDARGHHVRFAFPGCSDILGMLKGGRMFAIEMKRQGKNATPEQQGFLLKVARHGGLAFVARSVEDVVKGLEGA